LTFPPQKPALPARVLHHFETRYYESLSFDIHFERTFRASQLVSPTGDFEPAKLFFLNPVRLPNGWLDPAWRPSWHTRPLAPHELRAIKKTAMPVLTTTSPLSLHQRPT
jgi:hypothetical protein